MAADKSPGQQRPIKAYGWAARDSSGVLAPFKFSRRATGDSDVRFKIMFCGICHTDLHFAKNDWGFSVYPLVPGQNIIYVIVSKDEEQMKAAKNTLDSIIDTVSANHPILPLLELRKITEN